MRHATLALLALAAAATGCARMSVTESGRKLSLTPRPADCEIEFYRTAPPERPHDEVATLHHQGSNFATPGGVQEKMRAQACALGADAVLVTRDFIADRQGSVMTGTAVSYRDARERHRLDAALRKADAAARPTEERKTAAARAPAATPAPTTASSAGAKGAPAGFVPGRLRETVLVRAAADRRGAEVGELRRGAEVWIAPQPSSGWRRVWAPGGTAGWVEDASLERLEPAAPPRPGVEARPTTNI